MAARQSALAVKLRALPYRHLDRWLLLFRSQPERDSAGPPHSQSRVVKALSTDSAVVLLGSAQLPLPAATLVCHWIMSVPVASDKADEQRHGNWLILGSAVMFACSTSLATMAHANGALPIWFVILGRSFVVTVWAALALIWVRVSPVQSIRVGFRGLVFIRATLNAIGHNVLLFVTMRGVQLGLATVLYFTTPVGSHSRSVCSVCFSFVMLHL